MCDSEADVQDQGSSSQGRQRFLSWRRRDDIGYNIDDARQLLCSANRKGIRIPADVVSVFVETREAYANRRLGADLEIKFWNAYGILRSSIEPATKARRLYRGIFYVTLAALLAVQFYFLVGAEVRDQITKLREDSLTLGGQLQAAQAGGVGAAGGAVSQEINERIQQNMRDLEAYEEITTWLVPGSNGSATSSPSTELGLATLRMILNFLATYVLPALYGLLGACAFVLRQLSDEIGKLRFANDMRVQYTLRLNIGLLAGLAVGWFINPGEGASVIANLSPLALAFVAGYGSDLLFAVLDRIVDAFAPSRGDTAETREQVWGGLETVTERRTETRVAGDASAEGGRREAPARQHGTAEEPEREAERTTGERDGREAPQAGLGTAKAA